MVKNLHLLRHWDSRATIRNRPRRIIAQFPAGLWFPPSEQPLCLHPLIAMLGDEVVANLLVQSSYAFMQNIALNETQVVCEIANRMINDKIFPRYPDRFKRNLLTVVIDEAWHAYVANDFVDQVITATNVLPVTQLSTTGLNSAIMTVGLALPPAAREVFEVVALCIAENSITTELMSGPRDPRVNAFFYEITADHLADEGRHSIIFSAILTWLWQNVSEEIRSSVGSVLPDFIMEYLSRKSKIAVDQALLKSLQLPESTISEVLYDTHPEYSPRSLREINPLVDQIVRFLKKSGVFSHSGTAHSFARLGYPHLGGPSQRSEASPKMSLLARFAAQVKRCPESIAVIDEDEEITYGQLNIRSDEVAARLRRYGFPDQSILAVNHRQSADYVIILLGIWKLGLVCLPLHPDDPNARITDILSDAGALAVITDDSECWMHTTIAASDLLSEDSVDIFEADRNESLSGNITEAYVIYTSGSTGKPKGVVISHGAFDRFIDGAVQAFSIRPDDRLLQFCALSFDASLADIGMALATGATLCMRRQTMLDTSKSFWTCCSELAITILNLPASLWGRLVSDLVTPDCASSLIPKTLRTVIVGGEVLSTIALRNWEQLSAGAIRLINTYGPTETTIAVTAWDLTEFRNLDRPGNVIGVPFAGAKLFVLDAQGKSMLLGKTGELYIAGPGVGRYIGKAGGNSFQSELPAASGASAEVGPVYRTGDLVRWIRTEKGEALEYIGRCDRQLKIRGFRTEPSEIEAVINGFEGVSDSLVLAVSKGENQQLIGFVLNVPQDHLDRLSQHVAQRLPPHFCPQQWVTVAAWPLTNHGKIDHAHLLGLASRSNEPSIALQPLRPVERRLAEMWQSLLGSSEPHNKEAHFFNLGGHSLLAMRLLIDVQCAFGVRLTLRQILENPKLGAMAALIADQPVFSTPSPNRAGALQAPLSSAQVSIWIADRMQMGSAAYNVAWISHLKGTLNCRALENAINVVISRHSILRTVFQSQGAAIVQKVADYSVRLDIEPATTESLAADARSDARRPFDLSNECAIRFRLFKIASNHHALLVVHHHIIHDGASIVIFLKELEYCYAEFANGAKPELPALACQYADYARAQQTFSLHDSADALAYWHQQLAGYRPLVLPFRRSATDFNNQKNGRRIHSHLDARSTKRLRLLCAQKDCTMFTGLLSALCLLFRRYSGQDDIAVGTMLSLRDHERYAGLIGLFLNAVILRVRIAADASLTALLPIVKKTLYNALAHAVTPLSQITPALSMERMPKDNALFDIMIVFHNFGHGLERFTLGSVNGEIAFVDNGTAQFGLMIDIHDTGRSISLNLTYCTDLYDDFSVEKMIDDFNELLRGEFHGSKKELLPAGPSANLRSQFAGR